ncbi:MAG: hypothetical protein GX254_05965 [Clostridiales bacterium]|jgi:hypothetical protein|nr:hypothetical protein [Clostridiales bacterium]
MKKTIPLLLICSLLLLSACNKKTGEGPETTADVTTPPIQETPSPEPGPSGDDSSPSPEASPTPGVIDMLRPEKGTIVVTDENGSETVEAELVYQNLNSSNPFIAFSIYSDTSRYELKNEDCVYTFYLKDKEPELIYLELSYIMGIDAEALKPSFADDYIDFSDIYFTSFSKVGQENMECTAITAHNSQQYVEAYLINVEYGVVAIVLSSKSASDTDANRLSAMLDTLILHEA